MTTADIFKKIRRIEIQSRKPVNQLFAGEYRSVFKGEGLEFHEVREYQPGDDIRSIDWNVTARLGHPFVKKFIEERQRTIILMIDISASQDYGSLKKSKNEIAAELAAILAFSAIKNNDLVGVLLFSDRVEKYIPPKKGKKHVMRIIRDILYFKRENTGTDLTQALRYFSRVQRKSAIVFVISDFLGDDYERPLAVLGRRHDLIPVLLKDRFERQFPSHHGLLQVEDPESGELRAIDGGNPEVRAAYDQLVEAEYQQKLKFFRSLKVDCLELSTNGDYIKPLNLFFKRQQRKVRH
ncbi:MAG: DUF58 domain-containing protein [Candidatus Margulisbacteria bacterium]|nr:DUF58 domain-containing protein [Candidatus Margulisiibacteriota bacterium]MBU1616161.1 DUF58 domain-containing protein [Candidatus Margulisiibacteriota bacterium]MBU1867369.1 DUF58 domain-containing protein [Candidatus Margulisiibacteriota bacterium]